MTKLVLAMFTSLDGYIEGPNGFVPPAWSGDLETHWSGHALERAGHLVYGRTNFLFNKEFWEPAETDPASPAAGIPHAAVMNRLPKTVVSSTLSGAPAAIGRLKSSLGDKDIYCFGGAGVANSLISLDLVDEYRLMVTPVIFGDGKRLFEPGLPKLGLELIENRPLDTGAVILHYRRQRN